MSKATGRREGGVVWGHMRTLGAALAVLMLAGIRANAQDAPPDGRFPRTAYGVSAGPVLPLGDFGRATDLGYRAGLWAETPAGGGAFGRLEASYDRFTSDRAQPAGGRAGVSVYSLTANIVATGRRNRFVAPRFTGYLVGGLGGYATRTSAGGRFGGVATGKVETRARVGVNGGAGIRFPLGALQGVLEARAHLLLSGSGFGSRDLGYIPLVLGVRL